MRSPFCSCSPVSRVSDKAGLSQSPAVRPQGWLRPCPRDLCITIPSWAPNPQVLPFCNPEPYLSLSWVPLAVPRSWGWAWRSTQPGPRAPASVESGHLTVARPLVSVCCKPAVLNKHLCFLDSKLEYTSGIRYYEKPGSRMRAEGSDRGLTWQRTAVSARFSLRAASPKPALFTLRLGTPY